MSSKRNNDLHIMGLEEQPFKWEHLLKTDTFIGYHFTKVQLEYSDPDTVGELVYVVHRRTESNPNGEYLVFSEPRIVKEILEAVVDGEEYTRKLDEQERINARE